LRSSSGTTDGAEAQRQAANAAIRLTSPFWTSGSGNAPQALR
jgi:hypothetical protein